MTEEEAFEGLARLAQKLFDGQEELPDEFKEILDNNMWDLCDDS